MYFIWKDGLTRGLHKHLRYVAKITFRNLFRPSEWQYLFFLKLAMIATHFFCQYTRQELPLRTLGKIATKCCGNLFSLGYTKWQLVV